MKLAVCPDYAAGLGCCEMNVFANLASESLSVSCFCNKLVIFRKMCVLFERNTSE
jgi:hypothetical protein